MSRGRRLYLYGVALFGLVVSLISALLFIWRIVGNRVADLLAPAPSELITAGRSPLPEMLSSPALPWTILALLGLATWLFHIITANREARPLTMAGAAERAMPERKMYLYMGRLAAVAALTSQAVVLIRAAVSALLDGGVGQLRAAAAWPAALVAGSLVALAYYIYLRVEATRDGDLGQERGRAASWRKAYVYVVALAGALLAYGGGAELIRAGIRVLLTPLSGDTTWHVPAATALAALIVGAPLASVAWGSANRAATMNAPAETNALSRVLLRHGGVLIASLVTLVTLGYLVEQIILRAIGRPSGASGSLLLGLFDWPWALAYLPMAAIAWISFAGGARVDAAWGGERPRTAIVRRVVRYILTALSLAAFWYGLTEFARLILQVFLGADTGDASAAQWVQRFATSAAFLLVGAPAWWGHWWSQQMRVRAEGVEGYDERTSAIRRVYLMTVVLVGAVVVVSAAGFALFLALNWQSAGALGGVRAAVAGAVAAALVALFWTLVHGLILRGDLRFRAQSRPLEAETGGFGETAAGPVGFAPAAPPLAPAGAAPAPVVTAALPGVASVVPGPRVFSRDALTAPLVEPAEPVASHESRQYSRSELEPLAAEVALATGADYRPAYALTVVDGADGSVGARLISALRATFPDCAIWPVGLNPLAQSTMTAALGDQDLPPTSEEAFTQVAGIFAPSDALAPGALNGDVTTELVESLVGSPARVVLLPPRDQRFRWVAAPNWPLERWVENAVVEAGNLLDQAQGDMENETLI